LSYFQDESKGQRGIRTPIKPGRYLRKFFGDVLTEKQIAFFATWQTTGCRPNGYSDENAYPLSFARTPDDIVEVYKRGPQSCMKSGFSVSGHPARVYGAGDLAIAYLEDSSGTIIARALCWPENKAFGRVYPTPDMWSQDGYESREESQAVYSALEQRLLGLGYQSVYSDHSLFDGARILREHHRGNQYVMPYLDCGLKFSEHQSDSRYFILEENGDYDADNTDGTAALHDSPKYDYTCACCEEECDEVRMVYTRPNARGARDWCNYCAESYTFVCAGTGGLYSDNVDHALVDGDLYCNFWLENNATLSEHSDMWILNDNDVVCVMVSSDGDTEKWHIDEAETDAIKCAVSGCWMLPDIAVMCRVTGRVFHPNHAHAAHPDVAGDLTDEAIAAHDSQLALHEADLALPVPVDPQDSMPFPHAFPRVSIAAE
jgi:hypothetical protein